MDEQAVPSIRDLRTGDRYSRLGADRVRVEASDGSWGVFDAQAHWIEGPLRTADLPMCVWTGGPHARANMSILSGRAVAPTDEEARDASTPGMEALP
jgi:hypothetical protein